MKVDNLESIERAPNTNFSKEKTWVDNEIFACKFKDVRLGKRFQTLLSQLSTNIGGKDSPRLWKGTKIWQFS